MIVKYLKGGSWCYLDNVHRVENSAILPLELVKQFDKEVEEGKREPIDHVDDDIDLVNKAFLKAVENQEDWGYNVHTENILHADFIRGEFPADVVLIYTGKRNETNVYVDYDTIALVTNQNVFLMNDKGQTIERLI